MKLDAIDRQLLVELQNNCKQSLKEIAKKLNLSSTPIFERVKRLERNGLITAYRAEIDRYKIDLSVMAFCSVSLERHHTEYLVRFESDIQSLPEVLECYHIAGMFDYLLKVVTNDMNAYQEFVAKKLAGLPNIGRVQSSFVMNDVKVSKCLPILTHF